MDLFINDVDAEKFRKTNELWNNLKLNSPDNVGMVSELILEKQFTCKEEWEKYYYENGRPLLFLKRVARILYNNLSEGHDYTLLECFKIVRFRVICETWNGIIIRERNAIKTLEKVFDGNVEFKKPIKGDDWKYAVDFEGYISSTLVCGIQIKPISYSKDTSYNKKAKYINEIKNKNYFAANDVLVYTILSSLEGNIESNYDFIELTKLINRIL